MVSLQWTSAGYVLCSPSSEMKEEVWPLIDLPEDASHSLVHTDTRHNKSVNGTGGMLFYICAPSCQSLSFHLNTLLKFSHQTKSNHLVVMLSRRSQSSVYMHTCQHKSWATCRLATFQMPFFSSLKETAIFIITAKTKSTFSLKILLSCCIIPTWLVLWRATLSRQKGEAEWLVVLFHHTILWLLFKTLSMD